MPEILILSQTKPDEFLSTPWIKKSGFLNSSHCSIDGLSRIPKLLKWEPEFFWWGSPERNRQNPVPSEKIRSPEMRPDCFFVGSIGRSAKNPVVPHLAIIILKGAMDGPDFRHGGLCNIVPGPRGLTGNAYSPTSVVRTFSSSRWTENH